MSPMSRLSCLILLLCVLLLSLQTCLSADAAEVAMTTFMLEEEEEEERDDDDRATTDHAEGADGDVVDEQGGAASVSPSQFRLAVGVAAGEMTVSYVTPQGSSTDSVVLYGTSPSGLTQRATGNFTYYSQFGYTSGVIHHVTLTGLAPSTIYYYQVEGSVRVPFSFTSLPVVGSPSSYPFSFGIVADGGQTAYSNLTYTRLSMDSDIQAIVYPGDMAYADCDPTRWDSWGEMYEFLGARIPTMVEVGNHEVEAGDDAGDTFLAYKRRFKMPWTIADEDAPKTPEESNVTMLREKSSCCPSAFTGTYDYGNSYYSFNMAHGHFIALNSYAQTDENSKQYAWLKADLASVDRTKTPWIFAYFHSPWYNSNTAHQGEFNTLNMRQAMEVLLHSGGVDAVFNGHVHAYERSHPVFQNTTMKDGQAATYIVLGDGGNREGHAKDGLPQPAWSAVRNFDTYGHSKLTMLNNTHSLFEWIGNEGGNRDSVYLLSRNWPIRQ